ncbi:glycine zipper 2TM domain-containing protein [Novosphingobium bradum]|uniref:17 kDa surface antigen n=1 Tax=Novosphingobium bradum TaxID=1737444 RepID=A0ABV7IL06_9SPHN
MTSRLFSRAAMASTIAALALTGANPAEARACKRLNKTEGAAVGAVAGGVLGAVLTGGTTAGVLVGAAAGGVGGHEIARTKYNKHCRRYYRR